MKCYLLTLRGLLLALFVAGHALLAGVSVGTAISYQGQLNDGGVPANGSYAFRFTLYDTPVGGVQASPARTNAPVAVAGGEFTTTIDFGAGVFNGEARFLEIAVRPAGSAAAFTTLNPRQSLSPVPYALHALESSGRDGSNLTNVPTSSLTGRLNPSLIGEAALPGSVLADGAITGDQIAREAVTPNHLDRLAFAEAEVVFGSVRAEAFHGPIAASQLTGPLNPSLLGEGSVPGSVLVDGAITGEQLANGTISPNHLDRLAFAKSDFAFGSLHAETFIGPIAASQLTGLLNPARLGEGSVPGSVLQVGAITGDQIAREAVTPNHLDRLAFATNEVVFGSVRAAALDGPLDALKLTGRLNPSVIGEGTLRGSVFEDGAITGHQIARENIDPNHLNRLAFATNEVVFGSVRAGSFHGPIDALQLTGRLNPSVIGEGTLRGSVFEDGAITGEQIAPGTIQQGHLSPALLGTLTGGQLADGSVSVQKLQTLPSTQLLASIPSPLNVSGGQFGKALAGMGTDKVLIGAESHAANAGRAYLFGSGGTLLTTFTNPTPAHKDGFGNAVARAGNNQVLIGAPFGEIAVGTPANGSAHLFNLDGQRQALFVAADLVSGSRFGSALAGVGLDKVAIGASGQTQSRGAVYLFDLTGNQLRKFTHASPVADDQFGAALAGVGADKVVIGAPNRDAGTNDVGAAYLFGTDGALLTTFLNPAPRARDHFGSAVTAVGDGLLVIGAPGESSTGPGKAYLWSTGTALLATFTAPVPANGDRFGSSVAAVGADKVLIGAAGANGTGAAYLFNLSGQLLFTFANPTPDAGDLFGSSVTAVGSQQLVIGAVLDDTKALNAGAAYLFTLAGAPYVPGLVSEGVVDGAVATQGLANSAVTSLKIAAGSILPEHLSAAVALGTGPKGDKGDTGATGPVGPAGPKGVNWRGAWAAGTAYAIGDAVSNGGASWFAKAVSTGVTPVAGASWDLLAEKGATGAIGATGPTGLKGDKGDTGAVGPAGPTGATGAKGDKGDVGATGPAGAKGDKGDTGLAGAAGPQGIQGVPGPIGLTGATGPQGPQGLQGLKGDQGDTGATGAVGATGATGPAGAKGVNWRGAWAAGTAYAIGDAVSNDGASWFAKAASTGVTPAAGASWDLLADKGATGLAGTTGAQGVAGPAGPQGPIGPTGANGPQGPKGDTGAAGPQGPQGIPGSSDGWSRSGNAGTTATSFLGTTDNQPLEFRVNARRALRLEFAGDTEDPLVNVIGGYGGNTVNGAFGATVAGGGSDGAINQVTDSFGTVSGGRGNTAGSWGVVAGGDLNAASGLYSAVPGGFRNTAAGLVSYAAGTQAKANHDGAFVWSDRSDVLNDFTSTGTNQFLIRAAGGVGINKNNPAVALDVNGTVRATAFESVGGPLLLGTTDSQPVELRVNNRRALRLQETSGPPDAAPALIGGHNENSIGTSAHGAVIAGGGAPGLPNSIADQAAGAFIGGGFGNAIEDGGYTSVIAGGRSNRVQGDQQDGAIGGGRDNTLSNADSGVIGGGISNRGEGRGTVVSGGEHNQATGPFATVPGGKDNAATQAFGYAAGHGARAVHPGSFVWADSPDPDVTQNFESTGANQFLIRAAGGVGINTADPGGAFGVQVANGSQVSIANGQFTPELVMNGGPVPGTLRVRRALEIWPNLEGTQPGALDIRDQFGTPTISLNGNSGAMGLGVSDPADALHVRAQLAIRVRAETTTSSYAGFLSKNSVAEWFTGIGGSDGAWTLSQHIPSNAARLVVNTNGNVGIGTTAPNVKLHVVGDLRVTDPTDSRGTVRFGGGNFISSDLNTMRLQAGNLGIGMDPVSANGVRLQVSGEASKSAAGDWLANSDQRIKTNVVTVDGPEALAKLRAVRPVAFGYTADYLAAHPDIEPRTYLNVIAQEFAEVFPDWVKPSGEFLPGTDPTAPANEILQVDTYPLTIHAVAAIKELDAEAAALRARQDRLEQENAALQAKNRSLEQRLAALEKLVVRQPEAVANGGGR